MKRTVRTIVYSKEFAGSYEIKYSDIPEEVLKDDVIDIIRDEDISYNSYTLLRILREREETDEEYNKRLDIEKENIADLKRRRYESYLKLKKEFETEETKIDKEADDKIAVWWDTMNPSIKRSLMLTKLGQQWLQQNTFTFKHVRKMYYDEFPSKKIEHDND